MTKGFNLVVSTVCKFVGQEKQRPATSQTTELKNPRSWHGVSGAKCKSPVYIPFVF